MNLFHNLDEWRCFRSSLPPNLSVGFAPTMGNLHAGHTSLFLKSKAGNDVTVSSLFINPTQFNRSNDFIQYPRTLEQDLQVMEAAGVDYCILPEKEAIYADDYRYQLHETELCQMMEGKHRPGHFNGVLTIVMKLLNLINPNNAYFGEKDYQQYLLIKGMTKAFFMDTQVIPCLTVREASGLACSSRNNRLSKEQKTLAEDFAKIFHQPIGCEMIKKELEHLGIIVEYIEEHFGRRFIAVMIGDIRLIDNYSLT